MPLYPDPNRKKEVWLPKGEGLPGKMCPSCLCMQTPSDQVAWGLRLLSSPFRLL